MSSMRQSSYGCMQERELSTREVYELREALADCDPSFRIA